MTEVINEIPARLRNVSIDGHVAGAVDIIDDYTGESLDQLSKKPASTGSTGDYPYNGMGRKFLKKNLVNDVPKLTQDMMPLETGANTIYVIQYDFVLGEDIVIPNNCILDFDGGSISGAFTLTGENTIIEAPATKIFGIDIELAGTWNIEVVYPQWFGAKGDGETDDTTAFQKTINTGFPIIVPFGRYVITTGLDWNGKPMNIRGEGVTRYQPELDSAPIIQFEPTVNDTALFSNFHNEGARCENLHLRGGFGINQSASPDFTITPSNPSLTKVDAIRTSDAGGQKFFCFRNLTISYFSGAGIRFMGNTWNWNCIENIKFGYCKWGIKIDATGTNHLENFSKIHFANCEVGIMDSSDDYDIDRASGLQFTKIDTCAFEWCRYAVFGGSGDRGLAPIIFENVWFENIGQKTYRLQDTDVIEISCKHVDAPSGTIEYGGSRPQADRYNKSYITTGVLNVRALSARQLVNSIDILSGNSINWDEKSSITDPGKVLKSDSVVSTSVQDGSSTTVPIGNGNITIYGYANGNAHVIYNLIAIAYGTVKVVSSHTRNVTDPLTFSISDNNLIINNSHSVAFSLVVKIESFSI